MLFLLHSAYERIHHTRGTMRSIITPNVGVEKMNLGCQGQHLPGVFLFLWHEWKKTTIIGLPTKSCSKKAEVHTFWPGYVHACAICYLGIHRVRLILVQDFSTSALLTFRCDNSLLWGVGGGGLKAFPCLVGYLAASLASTH